MFSRTCFLIAINLLINCGSANNRANYLSAQASAQYSDIEQPLTREKALTMLKGCARNRLSNGCNEDTAGYLIDLYKQGDKYLLKPLLDAGLHSDAALSELLGSFFGELLSEQPVEFLNALYPRPRKDQEKLACLAAGMDGSGMSNEMYIETRTKLQRISIQKNNRLAGVAKTCLKELGKVNKKLSGH